MLVVVAVAANGFRAAGYLAAVSAAVWFDFFLTQPYQRFTIDTRSRTSGPPCCSCWWVCAVTELAVWGRRKAALASGQEAYLAGIREATQIASTGGSGTRLVDDVRDAARADPRACSRVQVRVRRRRHRRAGETAPRRRGRVAAQVWDVERRGLPTGVDIELLAESRGRLTGRYLMRANPGSRPTRSERLVAVTLAGQVGAGLR